LHFLKTFPSALKVYSAEKNVKWEKKRVISQTYKNSISYIR